MEDYAGQDSALNGFLVGYLLDLKAMEAVAVMEAAFAAGRVDEAIVGDWEDVQIELGLKAHRDRPRRPTALQLQLREAFAQLEGTASRPKRQPTSKEEIEARAERAVLESKLKAAAGPKRKRHRKRR